MDQVPVRLYDSWERYHLDKHQNYHQEFKLWHEILFIFHIDDSWIVECTEDPELSEVCQVPASEVRNALQADLDEFYYEDITQILPVYEVWYTDGEDGEEYTKKIAARNHQRAEEIFYNEYVHEDTNIQSIEQVKKLT